MEKYIEVIGNAGLVCDNPSCDWDDKSITLDQSKTWINAPCPKCGENVLTEEDYNNAEMLYNMIDMLNSLPDDVVESMAANLDVEALKNSDMFKNVPGIESIDKDGKFQLSINTHKGISVKDIKII